MLRLLHLLRDVACGLKLLQTQQIVHADLVRQTGSVGSVVGFRTCPKHSCSGLSRSTACLFVPQVTVTSLDNNMGAAQQAACVYFQRLQNAHNVLVASSSVARHGLVAKVGDFGLSRTLKLHATHRTTGAVSWVSTI